MPRPIVTSLRIKPDAGLGNGTGATGMTALERSHVGGCWVSPRALACCMWLSTAE
jgi:predicted oxidoreductase